MARNASALNLTRASFIARDDSALGPKADYDLYLDTRDERVLDLQESPDRYYVRGMGQVVRDLYMDLVQGSRAMTQLEDPEKVVAVEEAEQRVLSGRHLFSMGDKRTLSIVQTDLARELAAYCVLGFDRHPWVKEVGEDGEPVIETLTWDPSKGPLPREMAEVLAGDSILSLNLLMFVVKMGNLSADAKKR